MVLEIRRMNGTIYTDLTGAFPVTSARGNKLLVIMLMESCGNL